MSEMRPFVIVPTYNERDNLPPLAGALLRVPDLRVLVVDDGSPDGTGEVADRLARESRGRLSVLHRTGARGLGRSYIAGIRHALATDATTICQMDGDLSHDPADVPRLLERMADADLVIGSRYVPGGRIENWPRRRLALSSFANRYVRAITGLRIKDCTSGFRCWRREAVERLPLDRVTSDGYAFLVELVWEAASAGCRVAEVPITFVERRHGASKLSSRVILESALLPWRLVLRS
ncbi:MAG: polyprenol monophosphomannose synthase [Acidobacteria bacterium]|nr:polyprenol monophosphomannose synthase [Acidobacteriota bacterium]